MPGPMDIAMRIVGDARDAVRAFDDTTRAAKRTEQQAQQTSTRLQTFATSATAFFTKAAGGLTAFLAGWEGARRFGQAVAAPFENPQLPVGEAESAADTARRIKSAWGLKFGDAASFFDARTVEQKQRDRVRAQINALAASNPTQLMAARPFFTTDWELKAIDEALRHSKAVETFQGQLKGATVVNNTIVHMGVVGDPNAAGRAIRATTDRRDRNNGQATTTTRRR